MFHVYETIAQKKGKKREKKMKLAPISHVVDLFNVSIVRTINQPYHKSLKDLGLGG